MSHFFKLSDIRFFILQSRRCFAIILLSFSLAWASMPLFAKKPSLADITGVSGAVKKNIQQRLAELNEMSAVKDLNLEELKLEVAKAMQPFGFFHPRIEIQRQKGLSISIEKGEPLLISSLNLKMEGKGEKNPALLKIFNHLPLRVGNVFQSQDYEESKESLVTTAEDEGYLQASFSRAEILIDLVKNTAKISLVLNTGSHYLFGELRFDPTYISPKLIERYLPFHSGQSYSQRQIDLFNHYLSSSGYFKRVEIVAEPPDENYIPLRLKLTPVKRRSYSLGLGYGSDTGIRGRASFFVVPVNPKGHKFSVIALGSSLENAIQAQYTIPSSKPITDNYEIMTKLSNLDYDTGQSKALLASLAKRHRTDSFQSLLSLNALYERFNYSEEPREEKFTLYPKANLSFIHKSNPLFSPSGYNLSLNGLFSHRYLGSELNFSQGLIDLKAAWRLEFLRTRLYVHGLYGLTSINNINDLPLSLALLLGGTDTLKAYDYNSIGPGKITQYLGLEVQKETKEKWYLFAFYDLGSAYSPEPNVLMRDLGLGLLWVSPIGPIKLGIAEPVDASFDRIKGRNPRLVIRIGPDL